MYVISTQINEFIQTLARLMFKIWGLYVSMILLFCTYLIKIKTGAEIIAELQLKVELPS